MRAGLVLLFLFGISSLRLSALSVVAYNVENLFDADGVSVYDDYGPSRYTAGHLLVKVQNIAKVLAQVDGGSGPDIVVLSEIEIDQSPGKEDPKVWRAAFGRRTLQEALSKDPLDPVLADLPAEAWLLKALEEAGLNGYQIVSGHEKPSKHEDGNPRAIRNVVLSRLPVTAVRSHPIRSARDILEVVVDVEGHPLTIFANHWKSGASDPATEEIRKENARTLRTRLDQIFQSDPNADVVIAGDLNSHYNQSRRYRQMGETGINDILGSQGNELALRGTKDLYNLWFELPSNNRGSDIYQNEWGTLMHLIVSRGLYDGRGVQCVDNSFVVLKVPGLNADVFGRPIRWSRGTTPAGFSDHFPLLARFQVAKGDSPGAWMPLNQPSRTEAGPGQPVPVKTTPVDLFAAAIAPEKLPASTDIRDGSFNGRVMAVREAPATINDQGHVNIQLRGQEYNVFTHDKDLRSEIRQRVHRDGHLSFYGELGTFRGRWQFLLHGPEWLIPAY